MLIKNYNYNCQWERNDMMRIGETSIELIAQIIPDYVPRLILLLLLKHLSSHKLLIHFDHHAIPFINALIYF